MRYPQCPQSSVNMAGIEEALALHLINDLFYSDSSEDELEELDILENIRIGDIDRVALPRIRNYEQLAIQLPPCMFKEHFRMYPATFEHVLQRVTPQIVNNSRAGGRLTISPRKQLLMALWYFATPDSYRSLCDRFDVGRATAVRTVRRVTKAIFELSPQVIKWPTGDRFHEVVAGFQQGLGFPGVVGAIDGTHIPIPAPHLNGASYVNRKGVHSIVLQGVCDHTMKFTHCSAGQVGSVHDARVLRLSRVQEFIDNPELQKFPFNSHLIGDPAYPCVPHLMVAFKNNGHLTARQRNFNFCLSSTRCVIERAFGRLKGRFRCLKYLDMQKVVEIPKLIIACCVLHNICEDQQDIFEEHDIEIMEPDFFDEEVIRQHGHENGRMKRQEIVDMLPMRI